ncbi:MAG: tetratricopeptide repeat protein [Archangium sp.]|nr:tetratricopeptide repeat protein [Archangium sp.]MDP3570989.1 tetratricopeptide repeat protein [Archangium sp.]
MRIVCQKCSAAYAIDDKFVTPKGVRAQCPRCRHLQLVKKDDAPPAAAAAPEAPAAPGGPSAFLFDMGAAPPPPPAASGGSDLHFGQTAPAAGGASADPSPFDFTPPTNPGSPLDFGSPPPEAGGNPFDFAASAPGGAAANPFDFGSVAPPPSSSPSPFDFGSPPPMSSAPSSPFGSGGLDLGDAPPPPPASRPSAPKALRAPSFPSKPADATAVGVKCRTCGKDMTDPFDQALGVCDECRNKSAESVTSEAPPPPARPSAPARLAGPPPAAPMFPPASTPIGANDGARLRSAMRDGGESSGGKGKMIGMVIAALAVVGLVAGLVIKKPWANKGPVLVVKPTGGTRPVDSIIQQWRLKYPDLEGSSAKQLVDEGEELLLKDTTKNYLDSEEAFQQALVLDPGNDQALAGWVLSVAFGKPGQIDEPTAKAAESMLAAAEQRSGDLRVFVAHAHFLIARQGNPNDIKVLAERGLNSKAPRDRALASLAIGQTVLTKNPQQAAQNFREALAIDPKLKRAYFFQAQLAAIQGNYKEATRALERRLELDADQWEAAEELARLLVDVGDAPKAKKVLEAAKAAAPRAARPRLGLAILAYQHLNDSKGAEEQLTAIVDDAEVPRGEKTDALVHLATIQRIAGDADKASDTIDRALELNPDSVPGRLQKFLILLDKGVSSSARLELDGLKGKLGDKYLESTLEGRLLIAEDRLPEAIQTLSATVEADPRRVDAIFLAGAAAAKARKDGKAWEFCLKRGLRADPNSRPVPSLTHLYVRPADLLKPAIGAYAALVKDLDEDPSPSLCEGLVAWFSEDVAGADKFFLKVTSIDPKNADAYAYRAMVALRRKDVGAALKLSARGMDGSKNNAMLYFGQAQAQSMAGKIDLAKVAAQASLKYGPQLLGPKVILGEGEAAQKNSDEARRVLTSVLLSDPLYRDAKRVLYKHQL